MEDKSARFKGWCCVCVAGLLLLLLLLLNYVCLTRALTRTDHGLVGAALVRDVVAFVYRHCVRIVVTATSLVLGGESRYECLLAEVKGKLASLLSLVLIRISGSQGLLNKDTSLSHVNESLLSHVDKVLYSFVVLV